MVSFARQRQHTSASPRLPVARDLKPGIYRFQLQVTDDSGNRSRPATLKVTVVRQQRLRGKLWAWTGYWAARAQAALFGRLGSDARGR